MDLIRAFRDRGLPSPITLEVVTRAGITDSLAPRVLRTLEALDLLDGKGNPTPAFEGLRRAATADFKERLAEVIRAAYADVFQFTDPATDDVTRVADAFRVYDPPGQRKRMVTLFLGLCEAAGIVPEGKSKAGLKDAVARQKAATRPQGRRGKGRSSEQPTTTAKQQLAIDVEGGIPPAIAGLLASMPPAGSAWSATKKAKFMDTLKVVIDFVYTESDDVESDDDGDDEDE
jgi:hypothetical protein